MTAGAPAAMRRSTRMRQLGFDVRGLVAASPTSALLVVPLL
jgi:hypothetical protein